MQIKLPWQDPLEFARKISPHFLKQDFIFLYSGLSNEIENSKSYLGLFSKEIITENSFANFKQIFSQKNDKFFGYFAYELGEEFEEISLIKPQETAINLPKIHFSSFHLLFEFDHQKQEILVNFNNEDLLQKTLNFAKNDENLTKNDDFWPKIANLQSNFNNSDYLQAILEIKSQIAQGTFYQTNLTRKFFGSFANNLSDFNKFELFYQLAQISPANYSSFLQINNSQIISSSPELFLTTKDNHIISRPIKGTSPRSNDQIQDQKNKEYLQNSSKEKSENLMIVDLVRNDLSRICKSGSVKVDNLFKVNSYQTIHHLSSQISGQISDNFDHLDAFKACFPPGSMTGAPKIEAMKMAAKKERLKRGVYSGAIGMISEGEMNLSVVIRTLILQNNNFEFQVGGAITFDSDEKMELEEIFNKAKSLLNLLKIERKKII